MESQAMTQAVEQEEHVAMRILYAVGMITLVFGTALTGSPKASIAGVAILMFCSLF